MTDPLCARVDGAWTRLPYGEPFTAPNGLYATYDTMLEWQRQRDHDSLDALGVASPDPVGDPPEGKVETGRTLGGDDRPAWVVTYGNVPPPAPKPVPPRVTNFQGRAVMRQFPMPDGRSLFSTVDADLRAAVEATKELPEFDPARVAADLNWQAWEQANDYDRDGAVTGMLAARYHLDGPQTDALFRQAEKVRA